MTDPENVRLDEILDRARRVIPLCVAVGCIDTKLGLVLRAKCTPGDTQDSMDMVTAAMSELFRSQNAQAIDSVFRRLSPQAPAEAPQLQQVFALSQSHIYVYQSFVSTPELVLATVCASGANLGMVLARARSALLELQGVLSDAGA